MLIFQEVQPGLGMPAAQISPFSHQVLTLDPIYRLHAKVEPGQLEPLHPENCAVGNQTRKGLFSLVSRSGKAEWSRGNQETMHMDPNVVWRGVSG
jgi:hypothetical protein